MTATQIGSVLGTSAQSVGASFSQARKDKPDLTLADYGIQVTGMSAEEITAAVFDGKPEPMAPKPAAAKATPRGRGKGVTSASLRKALSAERGNGRKATDGAFSEARVIGTDDDGDKVYISTSVKYGVRVHYAGERGVCLGLPNWLMVGEHIQAIMAEVKGFYS